jgi:protein-tyrosine-phosphatase
MSSEVAAPPHVLFLCTGNATRSVIAAAALTRAVPALSVDGAGTLSLEGLPMGWRTRAALDAVGLDVAAHRSRQVTGADLRAASLIVGLAPEHVSWVRRRHPEVADRTATLKRLCRDLPCVEGDLPARIATLDLQNVAIEPWEEVEDPAGAEVETFVACAHEIAELIAGLAPTLAEAVSLAVCERG